MTGAPERAASRGSLRVVPSSSRRGDPSGRSAKLKRSLHTTRAMVQSMYQRRPATRRPLHVRGRGHRDAQGEPRHVPRSAALPRDAGRHRDAIGPGRAGSRSASPTGATSRPPIALLMQFAGGRCARSSRRGPRSNPAWQSSPRATPPTTRSRTWPRSSRQSRPASGEFPVWSATYNEYWRGTRRQQPQPAARIAQPGAAGHREQRRLRAQRAVPLATIERLRRVHAAVAARDEAAAHAAMLDLELEFQRRLAEGYPREIDRVVCWSEVRFGDDADEGFG